MNKRVIFRIAVVILTICLAGLSWLVAKLVALNREAKQYADTTIPLIIKDWNENEMLKRASPAFLQVSTPEALAGSFTHLRSRLGKLHNCDAVEGAVRIDFSIATGFEISGEYTTRATFEAGETKIFVKLAKQRDDWSYERFRIE